LIISDNRALAQFGQHLVLHRRFFPVIPRRRPAQAGLWSQYLPCYAPARCL